MAFWASILHCARGTVLRQAQDNRGIAQDPPPPPVRPGPAGARHCAAPVIGPGFLDRLHADAARAHPQECCGLLLGTGRRITALLPARNVHPAPLTHFEIDPQTLIDAHRAARAGGPQVLGYYHSHPSGPPRPSATDAAMAAGDGRIWAIVGEGDVTFWRDGRNGFEALPYSVSDR